MGSSRVFAQGYADTTQASVFAVPSRSSVRLTKIRLHNIHATTQTVDLYLSDHQDVTWKIARYQLAQHESADFLASGEVFDMHTDYGLELVTTTATATVYVIAGELEEGRRG